MIKVKKLYIQDIAKAPFIDRFFYYVLNSFKTDLIYKDYMALNPLKWSVMTLVTSAYILSIYTLIVPTLGLLASAFDANCMPKRYGSDDFIDYYVEDVLLIRPIK
tara:strand:+ start:183 stop:497 length:315 start_codon:yes stop_codon:yes gene_type:complete